MLCCFLQKMNITTNELKSKKDIFNTHKQNRCRIDEYRASCLKGSHRNRNLALGLSFTTVNLFVPLSTFWLPFCTSLFTSWSLLRTSGFTNYSLISTDMRPLLKFVVLVLTYVLISSLSLCATEMPACAVGCSVFRIVASM